MSRSRTKVCAQCGELFRKDPRNTWAYWECAKYCSQACAGLAWSRERIADRPALSEAFSKWFTPTAGCWEWTGARDKDGYGIFNYAKKNYRAAKVALELDGRPVPADKYACHHCDNPPCVRPDHLYPGTPTENMADAIARHRMRPWSKLTAEQVRQIRLATGTHAEIAAKYGVTHSNVTLIRQRKTWRHVT